MAKKHRIKREKYVQHLLKLERERDEYLAKRSMSSKRNRECRNNEDIFGEVEDSLMMGDKKRICKDLASEGEPRNLSHVKEAKETQVISAAKKEADVKCSLVPTEKIGDKRLKRRY